MTLPHRFPLRFWAALPITVLAGCHLVDQRDFDRQAGRPPVLQAAPPVVLAGPRPLLRIAYDNPDPDYSQALSAAVKRAMAVKPDVLFTVQTLVPLSGTPDAQAIAQSAAAVTGRGDCGGDCGGWGGCGAGELAVKGEAGLKEKEVRVFVH